ncbi:hypothetical protein [Nocardia sp. X0981]
MISEDHGFGRAAGASVSGPLPGADPLVTTAQRAGVFFRAGWRFTTELAERIPRLYLAEWHL